jgi:beta-galactosidase
MRLKWSLRRNASPLQSGAVPLSAKPKQTETVPVSVTLPADLGTDVFALELRCEDENGRQFYERAIRLDAGAANDARWSALQASLPKADVSFDVSESVITVRHPSYLLKLERRSGQLCLLNPDGVTIVSAFGPHTGRHPTINDMGKNRERAPELWPGSLLSKLAELETGARQMPEGIEITVSGSYPRPDKPEEAIRGQYKLLVTRVGTIEVTYKYTTVKATGEMLEAGFALAVPAAQSEFRWLGQGPYAGYPGKDRLNEYGIFHLNREDLCFPGNRREVTLASLASPSGTGILLGGTGVTVDMENRGDTTIFSHLALVPGEKSSNEGGENVDISSRIKASSVKSIAGKFRLLPLSPRWPEPLTKWLGSPGDRIDTKKPFLHSYDQ